MKPILVHAHVYYTNLWEELRECIKNIQPNPIDLYVTLVEEHPDTQDDIRKHFPNAKIQVVENRGFDVGPFIHVINQVNLDDYDYVVKLHTKTDKPFPTFVNGFNMSGARWRNKLLGFIKNWDSTISVMKKNKDVGLVADFDVIMDSEKDPDKVIALEACDVYKKLCSHKVKEHYYFVAGTMFVIRANILKEIQNKLCLLDFEEKIIIRDKSLAHRMERILGMLPCFLGYKITDSEGLFPKMSLKRRFFKKISNILPRLIRFFYQKKITKSGKLCIKVCKIPLSIFYKTKIKGDKKKIYVLGIKLFTSEIKPKTIDINEYASWITDLKNNKSFFVPFTNNKFIRKVNDVKVFAYYLPQFHSIDINDNNYGKGFTEWINVASSTPLFPGHYQPKIPYDLGFYNLMTPGVMERQVEIAKAYGLYGFCFYYYWFSGKKVLEKPLEYFLNSDIDFKFHFCWANENWSKLWDGGDKEVILKQEAKDDDAEKFFNDILPFIKDQRYEKVNNKPLLMIYRPSLFGKEYFINFVDTLNNLAKKEGFDGFYIMGSNAFGFNDPEGYKCEGIIEFPPHGLSCPLIETIKLSKDISTNVFDMSYYIRNREFLSDNNYKVFKTCFPSWDNTPRKAYSNGHIYQLSDYEYEFWLRSILEWTQKNHKTNEQYVYINAWNEWAEGAILEPTTRYGYKNLQILKDCLEKLARQ